MNEKKQFAELGLFEPEADVWSQGRILNLQGLTEMGFRKHFPGFPGRPSLKYVPENVIGIKCWCHNVGHIAYQVLIAQ